MVSVDTISAAPVAAASASAPIEVATALVDTVHFQYNLSIVD